MSTPTREQKLKAISSAHWAGFAAVIYISDPAHWSDFAAYAKHWLPGSDWNEEDRQEFLRDAKVLKELAEFADRGITD